MRILLAVVLLLSAAWTPRATEARTPSNHIVVGSKNCTESRILGEMPTMLIEAHTDLTVEHRSGLGGTLVCFTALTRGEIDLYPEYTGTGWSIVLKETEKIGDPLKAFLHVRKRYWELYDIEWLQPFGLNNTYALAMRKEKAEALGVRTISQLVPHAADLSAGFSIEFMNREDGWPGLGPYYSLDFGRVRALEHGLAYEAIASGAIDLIDAYSTDGKKNMPGGMVARRGASSPCWWCCSPWVT